MSLLSTGLYRYMFDKSSADEIKYLWRCRQKNLFRPDRIHTGINDFNVMPFPTKIHCHDSDVAAIEADIHVL